MSSWSSFLSAPDDFGIDDRRSGPDFSIAQVALTKNAKMDADQAKLKPLIKEVREQYI